MMIRVITIDYYSAISGGMRLERWLHQKKYVQEKYLLFIERKVFCRK